MYLTLHAGPSFHAIVTQSRYKSRRKSIHTHSLSLFLSLSNSSMSARNSSTNINIPVNRIIYRRSNYVQYSFRFDTYLMSRVFFFFLIDNWPRALPSHSHTLTTLSFDFFFLQHARSHTYKKRRRGTYGRCLYKINNDTSTRNQSRGLWC